MISGRHLQGNSWHFEPLSRVILVLCLVLFFLPLGATQAEAKHDLTSEEIVYVQELIAAAREQKLWEDRYWRLLLHYRKDLLWGYTSEADGGGFFNSVDGRTNPQRELEATLTRFFTEDKVGTFEITPQCTYVLRYHWLKSKLGFDPSRMKEQPCPKYQKWREALDVDSISYNFASKNLNDPGSMFGHLFFRLWKSEGDREITASDFTLSYAGSVEGGTNMASYVVLGLLGGFNGYFAMEPYRDRQETYINLENRDLWEYRLNLSAEQIDRILMHTWELTSTHFSYFFLKENCAYHLMSLLEVADSDLELTDRFLFWTLPIATIRALREYPHLIRSVNYIPSRGNRLNGVLAQLSEEERQLLFRLADKPEGIAEPQYRDLPPVRMSLLLNGALEYNFFWLQREQIRDSPRIEKIKFLQESLAGLNLAESDAPVPILRPDPPEQGQMPARFRMGLGETRSNNAFGELTVQNGFHELLSRELGYPENTRVRGLYLSVRHEEQEDRTRLEAFSVVDMISLFPRGPLSRKASWKFNTGWWRNHDGACPDCIPFELNTGLGWAAQSNIGIREVYFVFAHLLTESSSDFDKGYRAGLGGEVGLMVDLADSWRILLKGGRTKFSEGQESTLERLEFRSRFSLGVNVELNVDAVWQNEYREAMLSLGIFF